LPTPTETARGAARALGMGALTLSMLGGVSLHQRLVSAEAQPALFQTWMKAWADHVLRIFGVSWSLHGELPPAAAGARLVVSNHRSPLDILLLLRLFGGVVLSRADLAEWPVLGLAARRAETIFVDRADTLSGVLAVRALRDRLEKGRTVIVFPEGTTLAGDEVRAFQQGAFAAARGLPVEIIAVGIAYPPGSEYLDESFVEHMTRMAQRPRTQVALAIGAPRPMQGSRRGVSEAVRNDVQELVRAARHRLHIHGGT
jgi:1-acyl-sn-glycerol-3-phosphate acyltransferase